jgi:hypothetical protein
MRFGVLQLRGNTQRFIPLLGGLIILTALPSLAQVRALSVKPATVDAGTLQTMSYVFVAGDGGFAKGGGVRIEIPVAYAETESLLWSPPQTDNPDAPGHVWVAVSNRARAKIHIEGLLRGIVEVDFLDDVPSGTTVTLFYRGQVQGIAAQIDARYETRARGTGSSRELLEAAERETHVARDMFTKAATVPCLPWNRRSASVLQK